MSSIKKYRLWMIYFLIGFLMTLVLSIDDYLKGLEDVFVKDFFIDLVLMIPFISLVGYIVSKFADFLDKRLSWEKSFFPRILANVSFITVISTLITGVYLILEKLFVLDLVKTQSTSPNSVAAAIFSIIFLIFGMIIIFHEFINSLRAQEE